MRGRGHGRRDRAPGGPLIRRPPIAVALLALTVAAPATARKVDVGGHRLRVEIRGRGEVAVVFDAGLGDSLDTWHWVAPGVARFSRVVLYDRAGVGKSDPGPAPRTSGRIAAELRALLAATEVAGPYVLVGHSFGGLNLRLLASRHPADVAGLVLIEPTPEEFPERERELLSERERIKLDTAAGAMGEGYRRERAAVEASAAELRAAPPLPDVPVIVISSPRADESPAFRATWLEMQRALAARIGAERHVVAAGAGHYVQFDAPELVIEAIRELVERATPGVRGPRPTRSP